MERVFIYEICSDITNIGNMTENYFNDMLGYGSNNFLSIGQPEERAIRNGFIEVLKKHGAQYGTGKAGAEEIPWVIFSQETKGNYFRERFEKMKQLAGGMTLDQFSESKEEVKHLKLIIDDEFGDAVYFNSSFYTLDDFIRDVEPGMKYFIGNVLRICDLQ